AGAPPREGTSHGPIDAVPGATARHVTSISRSTSPSFRGAASSTVRWWRSSPHGFPMSVKVLARARGNRKPYGERFADEHRAGLSAQRHAHLIRRQEILELRVVDQERE